ncbi:MAG: HNH endonuclease [Nocardioides sp.]|uniref:HNH endonuclease n=1 Tax=Nocardioides sp. TaxID=35761 RepID=UPI003D6ACE1C
MAKLNETVETIRETAIREIGDATQKMAKRKRDESDTLRDNAKRRREQDSDLANTVPAARVDSKGRPIPDDVKRLPSGKLPPNWQYAGKLYDGDKWTTDLKQKYPKGVRFTKDGFPDFSPYAQKTTKIDGGFSGRDADFAAADKATDTTRKYRRENKLTWHHHQDGTTLQLVPTDVHDAVRHAGGIALAKGRTK